MPEQQPPIGRLGQDKVETLRQWGQGLATAGRDDEMRAAGRAILLLAEEIDGLERDLWHARAGVSDRLPEEADLRPQPAAEDGDGEEPRPLLGTLAARLARARLHHS